MSPKVQGGGAFGGFCGWVARANEREYNLRPDELLIALWPNEFYFHVETEKNQYNELLDRPEVTAC